jgi:tetratricopeptide (TPR) repeat protein
MRRSTIIMVSSLLGVPTALAQQGVVSEQARAAKAEGDKLYNEKKLKEALDAYQKAVKLDPKYVEAWDTLGNLYFEQNNLDKAIEAYQGGVTASNTYVLGLYNIAFCYNTLNKPKEAAAAYKAYLAKTPGDVDALYGMATALAAAKDNSAALAAFEEYSQKEKRPENKAQLEKATQEIARLRPLTKPAETTKADTTKPAETAKADTAKPAETAKTAKTDTVTPTETVKTDTNKPAEAAKTDSTKPAETPTTEPAKTNPGEPDIQPQSKAERARGYKKDGDDFNGKQKYALAAEAYRKATLLDASYLDAWDSLGNTYVALEEYARAIDAYKGALIADPNYVLGFYNLAYCHRALGQFSEALKAYRIFLMKVPNDPDALFGLAASLVAVNDNATAISTYEKYLAAETRPDTSEFLQTAKTEIERLKGSAASTGKPSVTTLDLPTNTSKAPSELPALTGSLPDTAKDAISQGDAYFSKKGFESASTLYAQAVSLSGGNLEAHYKLGVTLALLKNYPEAVSHLSRALEGDPNNSEIRARLDRVRAMAAAENVNALAEGETLPFISKDQARFDADALMKEGRYVLALANYEIAISYSAKDVAAHQGRGDALLSLGRVEEAKEEYLYAMSLSPQDAKPYRSLGDLHRLRSETKQARYYYGLYLLRVKATDANTKEIAAIRSYVAQNTK